MRGGCNPPIIPPIIYHTLLFLTIYLADSMASRFLLKWLRIATNKILCIMVKLADLAKHNYVGRKI